MGDAIAEALPLLPETPVPGIVAKDAASGLVLFMAEHGFTGAFNDELMDAARRALRRSRPPTGSSRRSACPSTTPRSVAPEQPETAFVADVAGAHVDILCVQEERVVGNDNCVRYQGRCLQIRPSPIRPHFVKARIRVHDYPDGTLAVFHGPRCLARFAADGAPFDHDPALAA